MGQLQLRDMNSFYGDSHILHDITLNVGRGEFISLIGRNGSGKTTTLKSIAGLLSDVTGDVTYGDTDLINCEPYIISRLGIAYIPEHRQIFPGLTVEENLRMGYIGHSSDQSFNEAVADSLEYFPRLNERLSQVATTMSGGEQQMLAIARGLVTEPDLLLIDEPTEGLMPSLVTKLEGIFEKINESGVSILLVEQDAELALRASEYGYIIDEGKIKAEGPSTELIEDSEIKEKYLMV